MRLLLDTHIWVWSLVSPSQLTARVTRELLNPANEVWLSPISVWETMLLLERGKLRVDDEPEAWLRQMLQATPAREAALTHDVAVQSRRLDLRHPDPADRFLAATAMVHDLTLVTADERLLASRNMKTLGNR